MNLQINTTKVNLSLPMDLYDINLCETESRDKLQNGPYHSLSQFNKLFMINVTSHVDVHCQVNDVRF